ncbi:MAG: hypothetical protein AB7O67_05300 [Vicinamibacterales bacterium]
MQTRHSHPLVRPLVAGLALALVAGLAPGLAWAQDTNKVAVMKRNGDRVSGTFEDMANGQIYVRVSLNDQRKIPVGDVAVIDVTGDAANLPETETSVARGNEHVIVFRDGTSAKGEVIDIRGGTGSADPDEQRLVYMRTGGEEKRFPMDNITRIYLGNYPANTSTASDSATASSVTPNENLPAGTVRVAANSDWVPTNISVRKGDRVMFSASGRVQLSNDADDVAQPAGSLKQRYAPTSPLPRNFAGALIGKVGTAPAFAIGDQSSVTMPADGELYLRVNDYPINDNQGAFAVTVTAPRRR